MTGPDSNRIPWSWSAPLAAKAPSSSAASLTSLTVTCRPSGRARASRAVARARLRGSRGYARNESRVAAGATTTLSLFAYKIAFERCDLGLASAVGAIWLVLLAAFAVIYVRLLAAQR